MLAEAVASVLDQTLESIECIVVDDGGAEPVAVPDDPRVSVVRLPTNRGTAAARNAGLAAARGRYVAFLDDDDVFAADRLANALAGHDRADIAVCWSRFLDGPTRPGRTLEGDVRGVVLEHLVPNMGQTSVRREVMAPFDERLRCCEDVEWWIRASQLLTVTTVPSWDLHFRLHPGQRHLKSKAARAASREDIITWHAEFFASRPRSAAFQWKRIGLLYADAGECRRARAALVRSLRASPSIRTVRHLLAVSRCRSAESVAA